MPRAREGQVVPSARFKIRRDGEWSELSTDELFSGRTVVLFALPGAFTPTCSATHLPGYNALAARLRAVGVDEVVCLSVNDAFVMDAWQRDQACDNVTMIPDGNGEFTGAMGMLVDKADLGFGLRSWRYSMLVRNGTIEKMFVEPEEPGDPFEVSDAETMLGYMAPDAVQARKVTLFSRRGCGHCERARGILRERGLPFEEILLGTEVTTATLMAVAGSTLTPQVFVDGKHVGGADQLEAHLSA